MITVTDRQWEQFLEGIARKRLAVTAEAQVVGDDTVRVYYDEDGAVVASMHVEKGATPHWHEVEDPHAFFLRQDVADAVADIYIATEEDWEMLDDIPDKYTQVAKMREMGIIQ